MEDITELAEPAHPSLKLSANFRDGLAGAMGSTLMVLVTQPIDTAKVNLQQQSLVKKTPGSVFRTLSTVGGPAVLWAGTVPALYMYVSEHATLFGAWAALVRAVWPEAECHPQSVEPWMLGLACGVCCIGSSFLTCPADFLKCRIQVNGTSYHGLWDCLVRTVRAEGFSPFWRNYKSVLLRDSCFFSGYIATHETLCRMRCGQTGQSKKELPFSDMFMFGGISGTVGWLLASPFDVINSRRQARSMIDSSKHSQSSMFGVTGSRSVLAELTQIVRTEGVTKLWTGLRFQVMRGFLGYGTFTVGYTAFVNLWDNFGDLPLPAAPALARMEPEDK